MLFFSICESIFSTALKLGSFLLFFLSFGVNFVFFLKIFTTERSYFIYYKLQANNLLPPTLPSFWLRKTNFFCLLPLPTLTLPLSEDEPDKVSNSYGLQNIFNLLPFSLVHSMIFSSFIEIFSSMFLIFMIFLSKDFHISDSGLLELEIYI